MSSPGQRPAAHDGETSAAPPASPMSEEWRRRWREMPFHKYLDLDIEPQEPGRSRIIMGVGERTRGGVGGSVHGGIIATLVDIATIQAVATLVGPGEQMAGTAELNVSYLRPALGRVVIAEGRVLKKGRSLAVIDVDCSDGNGRLFAKGRAQYALRQSVAHPRTVGPVRRTPEGGA